MEFGLVLVGRLRVIFQQSCKKFYGKFFNGKYFYDKIWDDVFNFLSDLEERKKCRVVHRGTLGRWFTVDFDLKYGCLLSPFYCYWCWIISYVEGEYWWQADLTWHGDTSGIPHN